MSRLPVLHADPSAVMFRLSVPESRDVYYE